MKRPLVLCAGLAASMLAAATALAQNGLQQPQMVAPTAQQNISVQITPTSFDGDAPAAAAPATSPAAEPATDDASTTSSCGCEDAGCSCDSSCGCDSCSCGCGNDWCCLGDCCLGDAWTLESCIDPCNKCDTTIAGWLSAGYYNNPVGLAFFGPLLDMNDVPDHFNLDQAWIYAEKVAEGGACSAGWGYRADILYGTDAQKTQAFGNGSGSWDNSWDNGVYGWALPQLYGQVAYGDWSAKIGHWYTPMGYEVVPDPGNFFYTHSLEFFNSEPFTHTGILGTYTASECTTYTLGWALGWDTGFDQFDGGNIFLGGISRKVNDDVTLGYTTCVGNFGLRSAGEFGYMQTLLLTANVSEKVTYVAQSDITVSDGFLNDPNFDARDYGIVNYLLYTVNDCWKAGGRIEWWKSNTVTGESTSFYELTGGVNYHPHANVVVRPEIRYDWSPTDFQGYNRATFGIDAIFTF